MTGGTGWFAVVGATGGWGRVREVGVAVVTGFGVEGFTGGEEGLGGGVGGAGGGEGDEG